MSQTSLAGRQPKHLSGDAVHVGVEAFIAERRRVEQRNAADVIGQETWVRHGCVVHEHRHCERLCLQGKFDLRPHMVAIVEQAGLALARRRSHPTVADQNQNRVGLADLTLNLRLEVFPRFDGIHVEEYVLGSEQMAEPVISRRPPPPCRRAGS